MYPLDSVETRKWKLYLYKQYENIMLKLVTSLLLTIFQV